MTWCIRVQNQLQRVKALVDPTNNGQMSRNHSSNGLDHCIVLFSIPIGLIFGCSCSLIGFLTATNSTDQNHFEK